MLQGIRIPCRLLSADGRPVQSFRSGVGFRIPADNGFKALPSIIELPTAERSLCQSQVQLCQEIVGRQKSLDAVPLGAVRFSDDGRRRPLGPEAGEILFPFLDVDFHWYEIF